MALRGFARRRNTLNGLGRLCAAVRQQNTQAKRQRYPESEDDVESSGISLETESVEDEKMVPTVTVSQLDEQPSQQRKVPTTDLEASFVGISSVAFSPEVQEILSAQLHPEDVEIKPDGLIYLPEIKYRRILHKAFGAGGWALMPRGEPHHYQGDGNVNLVTREFAMFCHGRFVSQSVGEHTFHCKATAPGGMPLGKAYESAKSNALMRCCKDLGIASELWDPKFISDWKERYAVGVWCENETSRQKKILWRKKSSKEPFAYPWKESKRAEKSQQ